MSAAISPGQLDHVDLVVTGMTCAACAARIEKKLNRLDGVTATVNYATERANVDFDPAAVTTDRLIDVVSSIGYGAELPPSGAAPAPSAGEGEADPRSDANAAPLVALRQRLIGATVLGLPVLVLSMIPALQFRNWQWLVFALAAPVATWGAWPFHRAAWKNARQAEATMDTLVSVGVIAAFGWSTWVLFATPAGDNGMSMSMSLRTTRGDHHLYLEVASAVVALILAGRYFETRSKRRANGALRALVELGAKQATRIDADGVERLVPLGELVVGDRFAVRPGEKVATDGVVEEGASAIDASLLTGESVPIEVGPGDAVTGATINSGGRLIVRATRVGADTALAQISRLVEQAQSGKAPIQRLADRVAGVFVPVVITLAVATFGFWFGRTGSVADAFGPAVAVLIIACPCALGLATPTALLVGTGRGAQLGVLIKGPEVLESTRRIEVIVLDKTGTITTGRMALERIEGDEAALRLAGAVEGASEHPIARAIVGAARERFGDLPPVERFVSTPGVGVSGEVEGHQVVVGRGSVGVDVSIDGEYRATLFVADRVRPTSAAAIAELKKLGLRPVLLSGDHEATARQIAGVVGIAPDDVLAGVLPEGKVSAIAELQAQGHTVAMVGDGVNDAAALATADLGVSMGTGADAAIEASDLTLVRADLVAAVDALRLSRATLRTIKGNLFWAFAYNVAAIPLAISGLLSPTVAGAAMALSSVFVVSNSLRLRRFQPTQLG
jgi:P-type Cu+ transporter